MSTKTNIHRGLQILFTLVILGPIFGKLTQNPQLVETFIRLGYPLFLTQILGIAYLLGIVGIWQPKVSRPQRMGLRRIYLCVAGSSGVAPGSR